MVLGAVLVIVVVGVEDHDAADPGLALTLAALVVVELNISSQEF